MDIEAKLKEMDFLYEEIWKCNFKDFEDLKVAIGHYEDLFDELDRESDKLSEEQKERLDKHLDNLEYFQAR